MKYKEYLKSRFAEMKEQDEYKDLKPQEKTQIIANEWKNREETTEIEPIRTEEVNIPNKNEEKTLETEPEDKESKYKYKCINGHYFNEIPENGKCPVCGVDLL